MTLIDAETGEVLAECTPDEARELTDRIRTGVEVIWACVEDAYRRRAWAALGYGSWDDYCAREFGTARIRLPREERQEVVGSLRDAGLSIRAISAATGVDRKTVRSDIDAQVGEKGPPAEPEPTPAPEVEPRFKPSQVKAATSAAPAAPEPKKVQGIDGKTYKPNTPTRAAIDAVFREKHPDVALRADLSRAVVKVHDALLALNASDAAAVALAEDRDSLTRFADDLTAWADQFRTALAPNLRSVK